MFTYGIRQKHKTDEPMMYLEKMQSSVQQDNQKKYSLMKIKSTVIATKLSLTPGNIGQSILQVNLTRLFVLIVNKKLIKCSNTLTLHQTNYNPLTV